MAPGFGGKLFTEEEGIKSFVIDFSVDHSGGVRFSTIPPLQLAPLQGSAAAPRMFCGQRDTGIDEVGKVG